MQSEVEPDLECPLPRASNEGDPQNDGPSARPPIPQRDAVYVGLIVLASTLPYLHRLGFSSDDWAFLSRMAMADDRSPLPLLRAMADDPGLASRPSQNVLQVVLFSLFGTSPLGYHIVGAGLLVAASVLLHLVLVEMRVPRVAAFLVPVVWGLSPAYATDRFWFAAFGYTLAMAALFLQVWSELRAVRGPSISWPWKVIALAALAVSALSMEVVVPLLAAAPIVVAWVVRRRHGAGVLATYGRRGAVLVGSTYLVLATTQLVKLTYADGFGTGEDLFWGVRRLAVTATGVQLGSFGALLPDSVRWAAREASWQVLLVALVIGVAVASVTASRLRRTAPSVRSWLAIGAGGAVVFVLGWSVFLTTQRFTLTSTGIGNRVGIAGALGVSAALVAAVGLIATLFRRPSLRAAAAGLMAGGLCASFALITLAVAEHWVEARAAADDVVDVVARSIEGHDGATVLLAGVCPYNGPAVVFESNWDLKGALQLRLDDPGIEADVVSRTLELGARGFRTTLYGHLMTTYDYGPDTLLVTYPRGDVTVLTDRRAAIAALDASGFDPVDDCPFGTEGHGVTQLRLDGRLERYRS